MEIQTTSTAEVVQYDVKQPDAADMRLHGGVGSQLSEEQLSALRQVFLQELRDEISIDRADDEILSFRRDPQWVRAVQGDGREDWSFRMSITTPDEALKGLLTSVSFEPGSFFPSRVIVQKPCHLSDRWVHHTMHVMATSHFTSETPILDLDSGRAAMNAYEHNFREAGGIRKQAWFMQYAFMHAPLRALRYLVEELNLCPGDSHERHRGVCLAATRAQSGEILAYMMSHGWSIEELNNSGQTPLLYMASCANSCAVIGLLEAGADLSARDQDGLGVFEIVHRCMRTANSLDTELFSQTLGALQAWKAREAAIECLRSMQAPAVA